MRKSLEELSSDFLLNFEEHNINVKNLGKNFYNPLGHLVTLVGYDTKNKKYPIITQNRKGKLERLSVATIQILLKSESRGTGIFRGVSK